MPAPTFNLPVTGGAATESDLEQAVQDVVDALDANTEAHKGRTDNPHDVTADQVGLGNVDDTADADKPISTAVQAGLDLKANHDHGHPIGDVSELQTALNVRQGRPGEWLGRYTTDTTGGRDGADVPWPVVVGARGLAVRITGQGRVALRDRVNVRDGQRQRLSVRFVRQTDPTDPSGATIRAGVRWLSATYADVGVTIFYSETVTAAMGLQEIDVSVSGDGGAADVEAPAGAVYAVPYVQTYDLDGVTLLEQIEIDTAGIEGPPGPPGPQGVGARGPRGPRGFQGEKGDPGNFVNFNLIGASEDIADRPASASEGDAWGLIENGTIRIYVWSSGAWADAGPITSPADFPVANTLFVSETGDDANAGTSHQAAVATIERAVSLAAGRSEDTLILLGPGVYETEGHIDLPDNCVVQSVHRTVSIVPAPGFEERNIFRLGSGCYVEGPTFAGWRLDSLTNPREGFCIAFRPGARIMRVPYAHKIVAYRGQPPELVAVPMDRRNGNPAVGRGMGVCIADATKISGASAFPNIMTFAATPSSPNGIGYVARNRGLINAVNAVSLWCHKHHLALGGGQVLLSGCSTQFGDWSLWSEGYAEILRLPTVAAYSADAGVKTAIDAAADTIIDDMWDALVAGSYTTGWTAQDEEFTRRDAAIFLNAIGYALQEGKQRAVDEFTRGMFKPVEDATDPAICRIEAVFSSDKLAAFQFAFETMRDSINALAGVDAAAQTAVTNLVAMLNGALSSPQTRRARSLITAVGHTWTQPLTGVTRSAVPPVFGGSGRASRVDRSVRARRGGSVIYNGTDDEGSTILSPDLRVNARTRQLEGRAFDAAVEVKALEAAIAVRS